MSALELVGWAGNALFFSRFLLQWLSSERAGRSVVPSSFWWLSAAGALFTSTYALGRAELVLFVGALLNGVIYARNLFLVTGGGARPLPPAAVTVLAAAVAGVLVVAGIGTRAASGATSLSWVLASAVGQALWSSRFALQWWYAEREGRGSLPTAFWWVSLAGNLLLLAYALHRRDAVLVAGFATGPLVQARNLMLMRRPAEAAGWSRSGAVSTGGALARRSWVGARPRIPSGLADCLRNVEYAHQPAARSGWRSGSTAIVTSQVRSASGVPKRRKSPKR